MNVIIGTRGSKLALAQAEYVKNRLQKHYPQNSYELKIISTKGDREQKKALDQIGDKGLFVREIEQELLDGTISLAVHSMKDMPAEQPSGLVFAHAWKREDPRDVLILREAVSLEKLPQHAVIGTGSRRRAFQLLQLRKDLRITGIRGNVDTRIKKMQEEQLDGIVLAAAGLHRLGRTSLITQYFEPEQMIPAAAQGRDTAGSGTACIAGNRVYPIGVRLRAIPQKWYNKIDFYLQNQCRKMNFQHLLKSSSADRERKKEWHLWYIWSVQVREIRDLSQSRDWN